jgi:GTP 3',8-cyclase
VQDVIDGIEAALDCHFEKIKLNCVLMRGVTESQLDPLLDFAASHQLPLRFIELMPLSNAGMLDPKHFLPVQEVINQLQQREELIPAQNERIGHGPARYYRMADRGVLVGFIGALTNLDFCGNCNKLRLTSDGKLRPCLGQHGEMDLKPILRLGSEQDLITAFSETIHQKPLDHSFRDQYEPHRPMIAIGG